MTFDPFDARGAFMPPEAHQLEADRDPPVARARKSIPQGLLIIGAIGVAFILGGILL